MSSGKTEMERFRRKLQLLLFMWSMFYSGEVCAMTSDKEFDAIRQELFSNPANAEKRILAYASEAFRGSDSFEIGKAALLLGELNHLHTRFYKSAFCFQKALHIFKALKKEDFVARAHIGIGGIFLTLQDFERSEIYHRKALAYYVKTHNRIGQADVLYNLGTLMVNKAEPDTALMYYAFAESIYMEERDYESLSRLYLVNGYVHHMMGNDSIAIIQERLAYKLASSYGDSVAVYGALFSMASVFENFDELDSARIYFIAALKVSEHLKNPDMEADALARLAEIYKVQDSLERSHECLELALVLRDSVRNLADMSKIHKLDFDTDDPSLSENNGQFTLTGVKLLSGLILLGAVLFFIGKKIRSVRVGINAAKRIGENNALKDAYSLVLPDKTKEQVNAPVTKNENTADFPELTRFQKTGKNSISATGSGKNAAAQNFQVTGESSETDKSGETARLEAELAQAKKELVTRNIQISQQKEIIDAAAKELKYLSVTNGAKGEKELSGILSTLKSSRSSANWEEFEMYFNEIHSGFYKKLNEAYPNLTVNERRLCGLICLNLNNKEISQITNKSTRSVEVARYRMRKKMKLDRDTALISELSSFL